MERFGARENYQPSGEPDSIALRVSVGGISGCEIEYQTQNELIPPVVAAKKTQSVHLMNSKR